MAQPRIRDFLSVLASLPAATIIAVCLFLPHTRSCTTHRAETAFESGTWIAIVPIILVGLLPILWRITRPPQREGVPELLLAFTLLALSLVVVAIPVAIYLMWGYAKKTFRGELLAAMCSAAILMLWLCCFPILLVFDTWLPAAKLTWGAGLLELVGMIFWISAAAVRPDDSVDPAATLRAKRYLLSV